MPDVTPRRMQPSVIRALAGFQAAVAWVYATFINAGSPSMPEAVCDVRDVPPGFRGALETATVQAIRSLDPIVVAVARERARRIVAERLANRLASCTTLESFDPDVIVSIANEAVDLTIATREQYLAFGA